MIKTTMYAIASASIISFNILTILLLPAFLFLRIENTRSPATTIQNISAKKSIIIFLLLQLMRLPFSAGNALIIPENYVDFQYNSKNVFLLLFRFTLSSVKRFIVEHCILLLELHSLQEHARRIHACHYRDASLDSLSSYREAFSFLSVRNYRNVYY